MLNILLCLKECDSVVEHSTGNQKINGSNPIVPITKEIIKELRLWNNMDYLHKWPYLILDGNKRAKKKLYAHVLNFFFYG